ncbi:hypothetical protein ACO0LB_05010 [Undibacterium sp. SXout7W]|uniref:hypothetical protein n=1 Tax=Undibacterium sp. SXout7W TaxID=3413049 RepID=UPI003BF2A0CB
MMSQQPTSTSSSLSIFILILSLHILLYWCWPAQSFLRSWHQQIIPQAPMMLRFLSLPPASAAQAAMTAILPAESIKRTARNNRDAMSRSDAPVSVQPPVTAKVASEPDTAIPAAPVAPQSSEGVNRDVRSIFNELKKDIQQRDKLSAAPPVSAVARLGQKISAASLIAHEGVRFENVQTFDGRPVTKVITPYGTYCVLQRKPGEIIGNEPMTVAVSCGNL